MRKLLRHLQESRAAEEAKVPQKVSDLQLGLDAECTFSKRAGTNIQFSEDRMIATRADVMGNRLVVGTTAWK